MYGNSTVGYACSMPTGSRFNYSRAYEPLQTSSIDYLLAAPVQDQLWVAGESHLDRLISTTLPTAYSVSTSYEKLQKPTTEAGLYPSVQHPYQKSTVSTDTYHVTATPTAQPSLFLKPSRPYTQFVNTTEEVQEFVAQIFHKLAGARLPSDIVITVCDAIELQKRHNFLSQEKKDCQNVLGFAINKRGKGVSEIVVKKDNLDRLLLTIGHELGHVMTPALPNTQDEEAKAFAFMMAWMNIIQEHNIGGLRDSLQLIEPAKNNVHDKALMFVLDNMNAGHEPLAVFDHLVDHYYGECKDNLLALLAS